MFMMLTIQFDIKYKTTKQQVSWIKKSRRCSNLPIDRCKFPTEDIMGAQNFTFAV